MLPLLWRHCPTAERRGSNVAGKHLACRENCRDICQIRLSGPSTRWAGETFAEENLGEYWGKFRVEVRLHAAESEFTFSSVRDRRFIALHGVTGQKAIVGGRSRSVATFFR